MRFKLDKDLNFISSGFHKCSIAGTEQRSSNLREAIIKIKEEHPEMKKSWMGKGL